MKENNSTYYICLVLVLGFMYLGDKIHDTNKTLETIQKEIFSLGVVVGGIANDVEDIKKRTR